jgi:hypothetical protein
VRLLLHGQADDAHVRVGHAAHRAVRYRDHVKNRADDAGAVTVRPALQDCVERVLRRERIPHVRPTQTHADDAPCALARCQAIVRVDRLVRAVERAETEMHDPAGNASPVVGRARNGCRQPGKCLLAKPGLGHQCTTGTVACRVAAAIGFTNTSTLPPCRGQRQGGSAGQSQGGIPHDLSSTVRAFMALIVDMGRIRLLQR